MSLHMERGHVGQEANTPSHYRWGRLPFGNTFSIFLQMRIEKNTTVTLDETFRMVTNPEMQQIWVTATNADTRNLLIGEPLRNVTIYNRCSTQTAGEGEEPRRSHEVRFSFRIENCNNIPVFIEILVAPRHGMPLSDEPRIQCVDCGTRWNYEGLVAAGLRSPCPRCGRFVAYNYLSNAWEPVEVHREPVEAADGEVEATSELTLTDANIEDANIGELTVSNVEALYGDPVTSLSNLAWIEGGTSHISFSSVACGRCGHRYSLTNELPQSCPRCGRPRVMEAKKIEEPVVEVPKPVPLKTRVQKLREHKEREKKRRKKKK